MKHLMKINNLGFMANELYIDTYNNMTIEKTKKYYDDLGIKTFILDDETLSDADKKDFNLL